jgi:AraC family transcriptional regulator of adaptative response/methylated-DNA-[protein]-cysteine methyltransferase
MHTAPDPRLAALASRDPQANFFYGVLTTGIYCRPSCGAKRPRPENIAFFATTAAAESAGYRPCKRCRPDQMRPHTRLIAAACLTIKTADSPPSLTALAAAAGLSPFHFHRVFKATTGVTPKAYAAAHRATRLRATLQTADTVTQAAYDSGYNASGRFYADAPAALGMTPKTYRAGGVGEHIRFATGACSLGAILIAASATGLCAISLGDEPAPLTAALHARFPAARITEDSNLAESLARAIAFIDKPGAALDLPLDIRGTAFQRRVWQALQAIPPGRTASYAQIAQSIGAPAAARAVAGACAANPLAVAIPCHRALRADGALAGYRWGLPRKRRLLDAESTDG